MVIGRHTSSINIMYKGAPLEQVKLERRYHQGGEEESSYRQKSQWRPAQDMEEQRATNPTEENTCSIIYLADNELWFRDMDLPQVSTEHDQRLWTMVPSKNGRNMSPMRRCLTWPTQKPTLLDGLLKRRLAFHGHLVSNGGITLDLMIGRLHGTRPRGRPRTTWLKELATQANISYKEAITIPRDRKKWRSVGNPRRMPDEWAPTTNSSKPDGSTAAKDFQRAVTLCQVSQAMSQRQRRRSSVALMVG